MLQATCSTVDDRIRMFSAVYAAQHERLVRYLTRMTRCPARAEDLAQATWLKLYPRVTAGDWQGRGEADLRACLYTAARNLYLDEYVRKHGEARTRSVDPADLADYAHGGGDPAEEAQRADVRHLVRAALDALPGEQRGAVLMWLNGTPIRRMAELAAAPVDTVLSRKKYAFARIRRLLGDRSLLESLPA